MKNIILKTRAPELAFILIATIVLLASGCSSKPSRDDAKTFLETLEWDDGECGDFTVSGDIDAGTSPLPFFRSKMHLMLRKEKPCPDSELEE